MLTRPFGENVSQLLDRKNQEKVHHWRRLIMFGNWIWRKRQSAYGVISGMSDDETFYIEYH